MSFSVTVLTSEAGRSSGYLLRHGGQNVLVDAGPGVLDALRGQIELTDLDAVVITHGHADHCLDLMAFAYALRFPEPRPDPLPVWVPAEMGTLLIALDEQFGVPTLPEMRRPIAQSCAPRTLDLAGQTPVRVAGDVELTAYPAKHAVQSAALRFTDGASVVSFSSDTGPSEGVEAAACGADLFLCEATYLEATDAEITGHGHLTARLAGRLAERAGVHKLLLTHLATPRNAERARADAAAEYRGELAVASRQAVHSTAVPSLG